MDIRKITAFLIAVMTFVQLVFADMNCCTVGWTGPNCEYKNQVHWSTVTSKLGKHEDRIKDGKLDTCSKQLNYGPDPFILVTLNNVVYVDEVIISFNNLTAVSEFRVYAGVISALDQTTLCYKDPGDVLLSKRVRVVCRRRLLAKYITVQLTGYENKLEICDLEIPTGRPLSKKKPSAGSEEASTSYSPDMANDGQMTTYYQSNAQETPNWYVDLQHEYKINLIELTVGGSIVGFQIYLSYSSDFTLAELVYTDITTVYTGKTSFVIPLNNKLGRYVQVLLPGESQTLTITELEVLGDCVDNYCGLYCNKKCFCEDARLSMEQMIKGICPNGSNTNGYPAKQNGQQGPTFLVGVITGAVTGAVVMALIIGVIIFLKRRTFGKSDKNVHSNPDLNVGDSDKQDYNTLDANRMDGIQEEYYEELEGCGAE